MKSAKGPGIPLGALPPPVSTGIPLSERFKAVKAEAAKKPQILAGGFGYGVSGTGVRLGAASTNSLGQFGGFPIPKPITAASPCNNLQFTRMMAAKMATSALMRNQFINGVPGSVMGRPNFQAFQSQKAPVLARIGGPRAIGKKKQRGFGMGGGVLGRGIEKSQQFVPLGSKLIVEKGFVGGRGRGRGGSRSSSKNRGVGGGDGKWHGEVQSKATLDMELDSYMAQSKNKKSGNLRGNLDQELADYMLEATKAKSRVSVLSGSALESSSSEIGNSSTSQDIADVEEPLDVGDNLDENESLMLE